RRAARRAAVVRPVPAHDDGEADDLRARARRRVLRPADDPRDRAPGRRRGLPLYGLHHGSRRKPGVPDAPHGRGKARMRLITKRALPRRTFLRGAAAAIGLPLLDAMVPALSQPAAAPRRLGFIYLPNGVA